MSETVAGYPSQAFAGRIGYVVLRSATPDMYTLVRECPWCRKPSRVKVPAQGLWDWEHGKHVQNAMPDLSAADREIVVSGTHDDCWKQMMPEEDD